MQIVRNQLQKQWKKGEGEREKKRYRTLLIISKICRKMS